MKKAEEAIASIELAFLGDSQSTVIQPILLIHALCLAPPWAQEFVTLDCFQGNALCSEKR